MRLHARAGLAVYSVMSHTMNALTAAVCLTVLALTAGCTASNPTVHYTLVVDPAFSAEEAAVVGAAGKRWETAVGEPARFQVDAVVGRCADFPQDIPAGQFVVCADRAADGGLETAGATIGYTDTLQKVNDCAHVWLTADYGVDAAVRLDTLSHIAQHELGHVWGLHHTDAVQAYVGQRCVMFSTIDESAAPSTPEESQDVSACDVEQFRAIWHF